MKEWKLASPFLCGNALLVFLRRADFQIQMEEKQILLFDIASWLAVWRNKRSPTESSRFDDYNSNKPANGFRYILSISIGLTI